MPGNRRKNELPAIAGNCRKRGDAGKSPKERNAGEGDACKRFCTVPWDGALHTPLQLELEVLVLATELFVSGATYTKTLTG